MNCWKQGAPTKNGRYLYWGEEWESSDHPMMVVVKDDGKHISWAGGDGRPAAGGFGAGDWFLGPILTPAQGQVGMDDELLACGATHPIDTDLAREGR